MDNGKGEFAFRQIFAEAFIGRVRGRAKVEVVVADLEYYPDEVH
jgi:hypothetical protein